MTVYVDSNFLLEIARGQDDAGAADALLAAARKNLIDLRCPSFVLAEPFAALDRLRNRREAVQREIRDEALRQFRRVPNQNALLGQLASLGDTFGKISEAEQEGLLGVIGQMLDCGTLIPIDQRQFSLALELRANLDLSSQDAMVLAAVIHDLRNDASARPAIFVSANTKDFDSPDVKEELIPYDCSVFRSFAKAVERLQL